MTIKKHSATRQVLLRSNLISGLGLTPPLLMTIIFSSRFANTATDIIYIVADCLGAGAKFTASVLAAF
jgi:hypothetical protein